MSEKGFTVFVLKYRTLPIDTDDPMSALMDNYNYHKWEDLVKNQIPIGAADARAAIEYVRKHATEYNLAIDQIGIIGFSAGGTIAATSAMGYDRNNRPDFVAPVYPYFPDTMQKTVLPDAPPMFLLAATNDKGGFNLHCISLYKHWAANKKPVELHLYVSGGHGFGMQKQNLPKDNWIERFYEFLQGQGFAAVKNAQ
ncbi:MAG TPA: alpha/beta hydrolase [Panacibacter sp.]|nr:alpha/beta hydrolase [Panacibacter sp.]HNP45079.1 alpha/beta hydrolase [Panacibacter sp.]